MLQLVLEGWGGLLVRPLHTLGPGPVHLVGVEPMTLRDETSGRTTTPVELGGVQPWELIPVCPSTRMFFVLWPVSIGVSC